jgi:hypothetical protein
LTYFPSLNSRHSKGQKPHHHLWLYLTWTSHNIPKPSANISSTHLYLPISYCCHTQFQWKQCYVQYSPCHNSHTLSSWNCWWIWFQAPILITGAAV